MAVPTRIEQIKADLLAPAFDLIKDFLISSKRTDPILTSTTKGLRISFTDRRGRLCNYEWSANENGKIYQHWDRPPDHENDMAGAAASTVTAGQILSNFKAVFRLVT